MRIASWSAALLAGVGLSGAARAQTTGVMDAPCVAVSAVPITARQAADFGGLCRYEKENARLAPATSHRVVFFGDSITELWKLLDFSFFTNDLIDRGVSGQTTSQMLLRFQADVIDLHPRAVQILAGTNDIAGNTGPTSIPHIEANIRAMVELAKAHHIKVMLASIPPTTRFPWNPGIDPVASIQTLNAWLRDYAHREGLIYVDYYSALEDDQHGFKAALSKDGVHPNKDGYAAMRPIAQAAIDQVRGGW